MNQNDRLHPLKEDGSLLLDCSELAERRKWFMEALRAARAARSNDSPGDAKEDMDNG